MPRNLWPRKAIHSRCILTQTRIALTYSVYSLPSTYFIDPAGNAVARAVGAIDRDTLQTGIDMIFPQGTDE